MILRPSFPATNMKFEDLVSTDIVPPPELVTAIPCPFVPALLSSPAELTVKLMLPGPVSLMYIACALPPRPLISPEASAMMEAVRLPLVMLVIWSP